VRDLPNTISTNGGSRNSAALVALSMMALVFLMRIVLTRFVFAADSFSLRDSAIASMLAPKGLAAAVLANLPLQYGVAKGALIFAGLSAGRTSRVGNALAHAGSPKN
jgi:hypothetical protein